jgi:hypothetical protein
MVRDMEIYMNNTANKNGYWDLGFLVAKICFLDFSSFKTRET